MEERSAGTKGRCTYTGGSEGGLILTGKVIAPTGNAAQAGIYVSNHIIQAVGAPDAIRATYPGADVFACTDAYISPGLINPHEHTSYSYSPFDPSTKPVYVHRDEWLAGLNGKPKIDPPHTNDPAILTWIELRHLMAGVTSIAGSGGVPGVVKNVHSSDKPAVYPYRVDWETFPFGNHALQDFSTFKCDPNMPSEPVPHLDGSVPPSLPYVGHVGEGTVCEANLEVDFFLDYVRANPGRKFSMVHGLAIGESNLAAITENNISVIWSPRSNLVLYDRTIDASWLIDNGVSVSLGTDWSPSGSYNMLEEMRCGRDYSHSHGKRTLQGRELWAMATTNAADALGIRDKTGSIEVGKAADITIVNDNTGNDVADIASLRESDVLAVFVDGQILAGERAAVSGSWLDSHCKETLGSKFLCVDFSSYGFTFDELKAKNANSLDLFATNRESDCQ